MKSEKWKISYRPNRGQKLLSFNFFDFFNFFNFNNNKAMKKTYINPEILVVKLQPQGTLLQASIASVTGDTDIVRGNDNDAPGVGDVKALNKNIWDETWWLSSHPDPLQRRGG